MCTKKENLISVERRMLLLLILWTNRGAGASQAEIRVMERRLCESTEIPQFYTQARQLRTGKSLSPFTSALQLRTGKFFCVIYQHIR